MISESDIIQLLKNQYYTTLTYVLCNMSILNQFLILCLVSDWPMDFFHIEAN